MTVTFSSTQLTPDLLYRADLADGQRDGRIALDNEAVRQVLAEAGITSEQQLAALDQLDHSRGARIGSEADRTLDLARVLRSVNYWGLGAGTHFDLKTGRDGAAIFDAIHEALAPRSPAEQGPTLTSLAGELAAILDPWDGDAVEMSQRLYEGTLSGTDQSFYRVTVRNLESCKRRALAAGDPGLADAIDKMISFYNGLAGAGAAGQRASSAELQRAMTDLAAARQAFATLVPPEGVDYGPLAAALIGRLEQGADGVTRYHPGTLDDFQQILAAFAEASALARDQSKLVNNVDTQLGPYFNKTLYRVTQYEVGARPASERGGASYRTPTPAQRELAAAAAARREQAARESGRPLVEPNEHVDLAIQSYWQDQSDMLGFVSALGELRAQLRAGGGDIDQMMRRFAGTSSAFQAQVRHILQAEQDLTQARTAQDQAAGHIREGQARIFQANTIADRVEREMLDLDTHLDRGVELLGRNVALTDPGQIRGSIEQARLIQQQGREALSEIDGQLGALHGQLEAAQRAYNLAMGRAADAQLLLGTAQGHLDAAAEGPYARALRGHIESLQGQITGLSARQQAIQGRLAQLGEALADAQASEALLREQRVDVGLGRDHLAGAIDREELRVQDLEYQQQLQRLYHGGVMNLQADVFAGLINAAADENGEFSRLDLHLGVGVEAGVNIGLVGVNAEVSAFLEAGIFVRRDDVQQIELGIDIQAALRAGVSASALLGLVEGGAAIEVGASNTLHLRFANEEDAARFLLRNVLGPIVDSARGRLEGRALEAFDRGIRLVRPDPPLHAPTLVNVLEGRVAGELYGQIGVEGLASFRVTGEAQYQHQAYTFVPCDRVTGLPTGDALSGTRTRKTLAGELRAELLDQSITVRAERIWETIQGDAVRYIDGRYRETTYSVELQGDVLGRIAGNAALISELTCKMLGIDNPPTRGMSVSGISSELFESCRAAVEQQVVMAAGVETAVTLSLRTYEEDMRAGAGRSEYQLQYSRASVMVEMRTGIGDDEMGNGRGLNIGVAKAKVEIDANAGYTRREVLTERLGTGDAAENYLMQNAGTCSTARQFFEFCERYDGESVARIFVSDDWDNRLTDALAGSLTPDEERAVQDLRDEVQVWLARGQALPLELRQRMTTAMFNVEQARPRAARFR